MSAFWGRAARGISAATEAWLDEASRRARDLHPERFAPDGTALIEYAGTSWAERLASWTRAQSGLPPSTDAPALVRESDNVLARVVGIVDEPFAALILAPAAAELTPPSTAPDPVNELDEIVNGLPGDEGKVHVDYDGLVAQLDPLDLEPPIPDDTERDDALADGHALEEPPIPDHDLDAPYARIREGDRP